MSAPTVRISGVGVHPFGRFPDVSYQEIGLVAARAALADAGVAWTDVDEAFCSRMFLPATSGVRILTQLGRTGIPISDVEAACASGAVALRQGIAALQSGRARTVLVLGVEKMPPGFMDPSMIYEPWQVKLGMGVNPAYWAIRARRHMHDFGTTERQIAAVAEKNHRNSVENPMSMHRKPFTIDEILASKVVCDPIHLLEICSPNDGAAAVVLTTADRSGDRDVEIAACEHVIAGYSSDFRAPQIGLSATMTGRPPTEMAARAAYAAAGLGPQDIDCFEVQDTDAFCEIEAYEELGICGAGEGGALIDEGATELAGRYPVNMSGGLISKGEPVGASHLGQIAEVVAQLRGEAGPRQVSGARVGLAHVLGAGGNCAVTILRR